MQEWDVVIVGAGAAGLFAAGRIGQAGRQVLLIDHAEKLAEKIRISGGGRCNFTNRQVGAENFISANPHYCRSALAGFTPQDFIALVDRYGIPWHEKHRGQLFCDRSAEDIIRMLVAECEAGGVMRWQPCSVGAVQPLDGGFRLQTGRGEVQARAVVVATGGLPVPKIGASDWGLRLARELGHGIVEPRPALVPLTFAAADWAPYAALAGVSLEVGIRSVPATGGGGGSGGGGSGGGRGGKARPKPVRFVEDLLFTHRGLSGPAILQISSYWRPGEPIGIDLAPGRDLAAELREAKSRSRRLLANELAQGLPTRLAQTWAPADDKPMPDWRDADLQRVAAALQDWTLRPDGTEGWRKAEVMAGGVDTRDLQSATMESRHHPGLYFIGEVVDVTGWLGGYNFQWAWASAAACARALTGR